MHPPQRRTAPLNLLLILAAGCGSERPPPCSATTCGVIIEQDIVTVFPDRVDATAPEEPSAAPDLLDASPLPDLAGPVDASDVIAPQDHPGIDSPDLQSVDSPDVEMGLDVPQDPPVTQARNDLGTRGLVASLPCGDVLRHLDVQITPRTVPANSFELRVRNASTQDIISVWYNATLNADWNIENLAADLAPGMSVTMSLWRVSGSPAWYVLGIAKNQHYYINSSNIFVELPCGRAARNTTQRFRETITP